MLDKDMSTKENKQDLLTAFSTLGSDFTKVKKRTSHTSNYAGVKNNIYSFKTSVKITNLIKTYRKAAGM